MVFRTSEHEETEDGHAVVTKATGPGEGGLQPTIDVTGDLQNLSYPHSGADTPTLAMNAAEVADSAALLDEEEAEAEISNEEAGRIGFRRLSSTPIIEVADIAAEVADSAQGLDNTPEVRNAHLSATSISGLTILQVILDDQPQGGYDFRDDDGIDSPPLFAHECVGMQNADEVLHQENQPDEDDHVQNQPAEDVDLDNIDLNDPTLERFPSNREGIINTVRRLESSLDEDRASFEGAPISPVVGAYRPGMEDITGDPFMSSPIVASPIIPRSSRHLEVPRSPRGSISSNHSSPLSLHAIDEGDEPGTTEEDSAAPILLSPPQPRPGFRVPKRSGSDEDEGIAMKDSCSETSKHEHSQSGSKKAGSSRDVISRALQEESPDIEASSRQPEPHHSLTTPESSPDRHNKRRSPEIVVESVEDNQGHDAGMIQQQDGLAGPRTPDSSIGTGLDVGTSTAIEESESFRARKRNNITGHSGATPSNNSVSLHPNREGGWFKSFFRVLFVDWIGGFITRLCGRRRQT